VIGAHEDVLGLDVAMDDVAVVQVLERVLQGELRRPDR